MRKRPPAALAAVFLLTACGFLLTGCGQESGPPQTSESASASPEATAAAPVTETRKSEPFTVDFEYHTLDNGLKVILSEDHTAPVVTVAVYYNIGFRIEPKDRTGFAHLFEHMMFQGSENLGKMEFISLVNANGGV
ncbi:MAG TPA: insulinase family protein, partial [Xanthomonadales bacterium]|nr:insulinase family protein [Xanthomonadales bacterium]